MSLPELVDFQATLVHSSFTITSGTDSALIDLNGCVVVGLSVPASVASTTMTMKVAYADGGTGLVLTDGIGSAAAKTWTIAASRYIAIDPSYTVGVRFIQFIFGTTETNKTYTVHAKPVA